MEGDAGSGRTNGRFWLSLTAGVVILLILGAMVEEKNGGGLAVGRCSDSEPEELPKFLMDGSIDETIGDERVA